jgi:hypothetical protein
MAFGFGQSAFDASSLSSDDEEYWTPKCVAEMTAEQSDCAACVATAIRLHLNFPPESPKNWVQVNLNVHQYHSDPMEISSTSWLLYITDWSCLKEETHLEFADPPNVARDIMSIIPHGVRVEARFSIG